MLTFDYFQDHNENRIRIQTEESEERSFRDVDYLTSIIGSHTREHLHKVFDANRRWARESGLEVLWDRTVRPNGFNQYQWNAAALVAHVAAWARRRLDPRNETMPLQGGRRRSSSPPVFFTFTGEGSGFVWAVFPPDISEDVIFSTDRFSPFDTSGNCAPGGSFHHAAIIRRTKTRTLVKQFSGRDI